MPVYCVQLRMPRSFAGAYRKWCLSSTFSVLLIESSIFVPQWLEAPRVMMQKRVKANALHHAAYPLIILISWIVTGKGVAGFPKTFLASTISAMMAPADTTCISALYTTASTSVRRYQFIPFTIKLKLYYWYWLHTRFRSLYSHLWYHS